MAKMEYKITNPCVIKIVNVDAINVSWWLDKLPQGTQKDRILIRLTKLNDDVKEIKCVTAADANAELVEKIDFSDVNAGFLDVKADFYYKKKAQEIQIRFVGVEYAIDVFGNQLTNSIVAKGRVVQIDIGQDNQHTGDCLFKNEKKLELVPHCWQTNIFLWKGNMYLCSDGNKHSSESDSFCRCCAQIIEERKLLPCPDQNHSTFNSGQANSRNGELQPVMKQ